MADAGPRSLGALDGVALREMFAAGAAWLEGQVDAVNALNVFPVPDGDTGTNMLLTLREALEETQDAGAACGASEMAARLARKALWASRGNSGVILSRILEGFARGLQGKERVRGRELAQAFQEASTTAYKALSKPVEGTILTVIREVAEATRPLTAANPSPASVLELACATAQGSVARTPLLLDVLRQHGVVDAGGQGLLVLLEGMARYVRGEKVEPPRAGAVSGHRPQPIPSHGVAGEATYGFCTEFVVEGAAASAEELRPRFEAMGQSVLVAGDAGLVKVHLHTFQPEGVLAFARSLGMVSREKADNIDHQSHQFAAKQTAIPVSEVGVVAVVGGDGLAALFRSLGAAAIVPGGQTMNPSAQEILQAALGVPAQKVIVLPNNRNVILAARQAQELAQEKELHVAPTEDLAQGVSAMMAFNYEEGLPANLAAMEEARAAVRTGEVTRAVRAARIDGRAVAKGQAIGLTGGALAVADAEVNGAAQKLLDRMGVEEGSAVTLYYGADVSPAQAEEAQRRIQQRFPKAEVQAFYGGQPHYHYLLAVE